MWLLNLISLSVSLHYLCINYCNFHTSNLKLFTWKITVYGRVFSDWYLLTSLNLFLKTEDKCYIFCDIYLSILQLFEAILKIRKYEKFVPPGGLEPPTSHTGTLTLYQLSYRGNVIDLLWMWELICMSNTIFFHLLWDIFTDCSTFYYS